MENEQNMNTLGTEIGFVMEPRDERDHAKSNNDIMARRLKNRERQRRYRERKRLEADMKKAPTINSSKPLLLEMHVNRIPNNFVTTVRRRRDWKKDARRAHAVKEKEVKLNNVVVAGFTSANESQLTLLPFGSEVNQPIQSFDSQVPFLSQLFSVVFLFEREEEVCGDLGAGRFGVRFTEIKVVNGLFRFSFGHVVSVLNSGSVLAMLVWVGGCVGDVQFAASVHCWLMSMVSAGLFCYGSAVLVCYGYAVLEGV
ncbi:hypothetical protein RHGRI_020371 [Rhododendron griersonianum]|uniref:BZIP domain-containing protein n=1 Tax=Rhododendron griersonianum TaxID=479676 RepID=A0AAV6JG56_9ERIC|nr:hypothetical protein RHGRI_020371 [Rhododendron griersonianum]